VQFNLTSQINYTLSLVSDLHAVTVFCVVDSSCGVLMMTPCFGHIINSDFVTFSVYVLSGAGQSPSRVHVMNL